MVVETFASKEENIWWYLSNINIKIPIKSIISKQNDIHTDKERDVLHSSYVFWYFNTIWHIP